MRTRGTLGRYSSAIRAACAKERSCGSARGLCQEDEKSLCCTKDGGGPSGAALWEEASNCRKLLRTKAAVVNVPVKRRGIGSRHVRIRKTSESEPVGKASKRSTMAPKPEPPPCSGNSMEDDLLTGHAVSGVQEA